MNRPTFGQPQFDEIPEALRSKDRWVCWRLYETKDGKWTKMPVDAKSGAAASSTDSKTWSDFETARARYDQDGVDGVGVVLGDGLVGVDLDGHRETESGTLTPFALGIVGRLRSYAEVSPSGRGVHVLLRGAKPLGRCRRDDQGLEVYDHGRYFTVTGLRLKGVPLLDDVPASVESRQEELDALCVRLLGANGDAPERQGTIAGPSDVEGQAVRDALSDDEIIRIATTAQNGEKVRRLLDGDTSMHNGDDSAADAALVAHMAFYCGPNAARIDRLFRPSKLMRAKWGEPRGEETYGQRTIRVVLNKCTQFYSPQGVEGATPTHGRAEKIQVKLEHWTEALDEMTEQAWGVLNEANDPPRFFRSGSAPVRIEFEDDGSPFLRGLNDDRLRHVLMAQAAWYRVVRDKDNEEKRVRTALPAQLLKNMLSCPKIPLPVLSGIVEAPVFSSTGELRTTPGYDPATRTFFDASSGLIVPSVALAPTRDELANAVRILCVEVLGDFPFVGDAEMAHTVSMMLLPFARELIHGPTPLHLIEKPCPGTGASLMAELPGIVFSGRAASAMTEGRDEDEWRKRLFAKLRRGPSIILIDNLRRRLDSAAFSSAITAWPCWEDRILGVSETLRVPVRAMWIGTGNNPAVSNEISRRTVRIRLDAKVDQPWLREDFRHQNLRAWVHEHRGEVVWACLTIVRAWVAAGRPNGSRGLGMFDSWAQVMGGILEVAEVPGFLGNLTEFYLASDEEGGALRRLVHEWWNRFKDGDVGVAELFSTASTIESLDLGDKGEASRRSRLGKILSNLRDRVFTVSTGESHEPIRVVVTSAGRDHGALAWRLVPSRKEGRE